MTPAAHPRRGLPSPTRIALPERGATSVWDSGPPTESTRAPLLLLHGWNIDAPANFGYAFDALSVDRRVVMFDQHGHGEGVRPTSRFTLDDAAADAIAVLDQLDIHRAVIVGYSMGGAIAQLVARRAPHRCAGAILMATADRFCDSRRDQRQFAVFHRGARVLDALPAPARDRAFDRIAGAACKKYPDWVLETVKQADPVALLDAAASLGTFDSTEWSGALTPPVAFVYTSRDSVVPPRRQIRLANALGVVHMHSVDADHDLPIRDDPRFARAILKTVAAIDQSHDATSPWLPSTVDAAH